MRATDQEQELHEESGQVRERGQLTVPAESRRACGLSDGTHVRLVPGGDGFYVLPVELERLTRWYVEQHNSVMPHFAFDGQTPDEMYFGTGVAVPAALAKAHAGARTERIEVNRKLQRASCGPPRDQPAPAPDPVEKP